MRGLSPTVLVLASMALASVAVANSVQPPKDWITIRAGNAFTFRAPPGTAPYSDGAPIDSLVGMYRNSSFSLQYDYGLYSNDLSGIRSKPGYSTKETEIDSREAIIVTGRGEGFDGCNDYMSAVYLVVSHDWISGRTVKLMMSGCTKERNNLPMLHKVFHSLRITSS
mgnify:FL=1